MTTPEQPEIDVFGYLDYRAFLRDHYLARKARGRGFSYRAFSRRAALKSPNYLKLVIDGERNLSAAMAERFAAACRLTGDELRYFVDLVAFTQSTTLSERNACYARMTGFQRYRQAQKLELAHAAYYGAWYMPAIRELAASPAFSADPDWIAARLLPAITPLDAARAIETLLELGLLVRAEDGRIAQGEGLISTGPETHGLHIASYHRAMMQRAVESIDLVAATERDISSLTVCVGKHRVHAFKQRIQRFRRELLELSALEDEPEQVLQINFQLFPLSRTEGKP